MPWMPPLGAVIPVLLLLALVAELLLGLFVLERGEGQLSVRFLGATMLLHAVTFGVFSAWDLLRRLTGGNLTDSTILLTLLLMPFVPALLLAFALVYPRPQRALEDRRWLLGLPFLPPVSHLVVIAVDPNLMYAGNPPLPMFVFLAYLLVGAGLAAGIFWARARPARTELEAGRLSYMAKAIGVPVALVGGLAAVLFTVLDVGGPFEPVPGAGISPIDVISLLALLPALGLGYGVLKYRVLDIDLKVKTGIRNSTLAAIFVAVFFVVSEGAQVLFAGFAGSEMLGVLASGALVFFLAPLQRVAQRVSDTAMPDVEDTPEHRTRRKTEVYRATLEEVLADGQMSAKDRRVLLRLQESLELEAEAAQRLEREVLEAFGGSPS